MEPQATDPNDWREMWAWIDGTWQYVRADSLHATYGHICVESYSEPGRLYQLPMHHVRRGEKPAAPPAERGWHQ